MKDLFTNPLRLRLLLDIAGFAAESELPSKMGLKHGFLIVSLLFYILARTGVRN